MRPPTSVSSSHSVTPTLGRFTDLSAQWADIEQRARATQTANWSNAIAAMTEQAAVAVRTGRWRTGPADLLGVLGRDRDELTHSRMLAWVLNPLGQHGLGPSLLEAFVQRLDPERRDLGGDLYQARVRLEVTRAGSRADIVVDLAQGGIVIENKVDAIEQPDQCLRQANDYQRHLLVFLTPHGHPPTTAGTSIERWNLMSWRDITAMLRELTPPHEAAAGRALADYVTTLTRLFA